MTIELIDGRSARGFALVDQLGEMVGDQRGFDGWRNAHAGAHALIGVELKEIYRVVVIVFVDAGSVERRGRGLAIFRENFVTQAEHLIEEFLVRAALGPVQNNDRESAFVHLRDVPWRRGVALPASFSGFWGRRLQFRLLRTKNLNQPHKCAAFPRNRARSGGKRRWKMSLAVVPQAAIREPLQPIVLEPRERGE